MCKHNIFLSNKNAKEKKRKWIWRKFAQFILLYISSANSYTHALSLSLSRYIMYDCNVAGRCCYILYTLLHSNSPYSGFGAFYSLQAWFSFDIDVTCNWAEKSAESQWFLIESIVELNIHDHKFAIVQTCKPTSDGGKYE